MMLVKNSTPFAYGTTSTSRRPPQPEIVLVVRGKFVIQPNGVMTVPPGRPFEVQGPVTGEIYAKDDEDKSGECLYPDDLAELKLNAEVLARGTCHAPGGRPVPECPARIGVGTWSKILRVTGPRVWSDGIATRPVSFTKMAVTYSNALGGPTHPPNPAGKGIGTPEAPTVESPDQPIRSTDDRFAPAGFGPIAAAWPQRQKKLAATKKNPKGRSFHADDFDWTYFRAAPDDQQLPGFLKGNEELTFHNLHPTHSILSTRLPGVRVRAFLKDVAQRFREVRMNLDTVYAELDEGFVYVTWRGLDAVMEMDLLDVKTVLFVTEDLASDPRPASVYKTQLEDFEKDPKRLDEFLTEEENAQVKKALAIAAPPTGAAKEGDPLPPEVTERLGRLDPKAQDRLGSQLAALMANGKKHGVDLAGHIAAALDRAAPPGAPRKPGKTGGGGLKASLDALHQQMDAARWQNASSGKPMHPGFDQYDAAREDPRMAAIGGKPGPSGAAPPPEMPGPNKNLAGQDFEKRDLSGQDLSGSILDGAILTKANLRGTSFKKASLRGAVLSEAELAEADFTEADLTEAILEKAQAQGATFTGATLTRTIFHEADASKASFTSSRGESPIFTKAKLDEARFDKGKFVKLVANESSFERASFAHADLDRSVLSKCNCKNAVFTGATLTKSSFFGSVMAKAAFMQARGDGTIWIEADISSADFSQADLPNAMFNLARASRVKFKSANLAHGKFYKTLLDHGELAHANLIGANFTRASINETKFNGANLYDGRFIGVTGTGYDLSDANLKSAMLEINDGLG